MEESNRIRQEFVKFLNSRHKLVPVSVESSPCENVVSKSGEPLADFSIPLSATEAEQLEEERVVLVTEDGEQGRLPVLIIKPKFSKRQGKRSPIVLMLHSSYKSKESTRPFLEYFAVYGYIAVSIDVRYHGERGSCDSSYQDAMVSSWKTGTEMPFIFDTVWDVMRLMDYLVGREDVDASRIGMTGVSLGGMITLYSIAADSRITAAVPMIGVQNFGWAVENNRWQARVESIPHCFNVAAEDLEKSCVDSEVVAAVWERIAPGLVNEFDVQEILKAVAPRPILILNGKEDPRCPVEGLESCVQKTAELYTKLGCPNSFKFIAEENVGHWITDSMLIDTREWFEKFITTTVDEVNS